MTASPDHEHVWGPLTHAPLTGNPVRPCQIPGCRVVYMDLGEPEPECQWFHACHNLANGTVHHNILGDVPTCGLCAAMLDLELTRD